MGMEVDEVEVEAADFLAVIEVESNRVLLEAAQTADEKAKDEEKNRKAKKKAEKKKKKKKAEKKKGAEKKAAGKALHKAGFAAPEIAVKGDHKLRLRQPADLGRNPAGVFG